MRKFLHGLLLVAVIGVYFYSARPVEAAFSIAGSNSFAGTTSVAMPITDLQITGTGTEPIPVKLFVTSGSLQMSTTTGLTFTGGTSGSTLYFSGSLANINAALATLTYTRGSTGSDTLEVSLVNPGEVFFAGNNHLYKFISGSISWNSAKPAAEALTAYGASGYLATITSQEENDFVSGRLTGDGWLGGSDSAVEGTWRWTTGPESGTAFWSGTAGGSTVGGSYAHWNGGEPNQSGEEDCLETYVSSGSWNDLPCSASVSGYVVEFGAPGNLPTVVAKNISITTSNTPTANSFTPADNATGVTLNANVVITLSQSVTVGTGSVLIKKSSDDSTVETIDVTSGLVTGGGTNTITINPTTTFAESTGYYVTIPGTAFKNISNAFYAGISSTSGWNFTTGDFTAPVISAVAATSTATTAGITWATNELASTKVNYGPTSGYGLSTSETDTSPRVLSHTVSLTSLLPCTTYHYQVVSKDASTNTGSSSDDTFVTSGCTASVAPTAVSETAVTVSSGGTVSTTGGNNTLTVTAPSNFTSAASSVVIQVQALPGSSVLNAISKPSGGVYTIGSVVFDVKAIINSTTVLDSFDAPVTISQHYTDADVDGLEESTLRLYHYHASSWSALDNCSVNTGANIVTCTSPSFSIFAVFGQPLSVGGGLPPAAYNKITSPAGGFAVSINNGATTTTSAEVNLNFTVGSDTARMALSNTPDFVGSGIETFIQNKKWTFPPGSGAKTIYVKFYTAFGQPSEVVSDSIILSSAGISPAPVVSAAPITPFQKNLQLGMSSQDVLRLQQFLNAQGLHVAETGAGSPGKETKYFGQSTFKALKRYQELHAAEILTSSGLKRGTGYFGPATRNYINSVLSR